MGVHRTWISSLPLLTYSPITSIKLIFPPFLSPPSSLLPLSLFHSSLFPSPLASGHQCLHNLHYWRAADVIGVGPGAHGRFHTLSSYFSSLSPPLSLLSSPPSPSLVEKSGHSHDVTPYRISTNQIRQPMKWIDVGDVFEIIIIFLTTLQGVESRGFGSQEIEIIDRTSHLMEHILVGLRSAEGVPIQIWKEAERCHVIRSSSAKRMFAENLLQYRQHSSSPACIWINEKTVEESIRDDIEAVRVRRDALPILDSITRDLLV